jgi:arylsulfatase
MDSRIGEVLAALKQLKLDQKTIVVFLSDNGPEPGQRNWARATPFRGLKWSSLEGGTRVPCIVRWPGVIPAGQASDKLTAAIDLLPTLAHACGIDLERVSKESPKLDGVNVWDTLIGGNQTSHARTDLLYWNGWARFQAIRVGDWKLYMDHVKEIRGSQEGPVLIHLAEDPAEQTNLSDKHPEKVNQLTALAEKQLAEIEENAIPLGGPPTRR